VRFVVERDPARCLERCEPHLVSREAENNIILSLLLAHRVGTSLPGDLVFAHLEDADAVLGCAVLVPPRNLLLSSCASEVAAQLAIELFATGARLPGILGPTEAVEAFVVPWQQASGARMERIQEQGIYVLTKVTSPEDTRGQLRRALPEECDRIADWHVDFEREALPHEAPDPISMRAAVERRIERGDVFVWISDDRPVSTASRTRPTRHGIGINAVYTPDEYRRRGFATSLVAAMAQTLLDEGYHFCYLHTDLANPTSNALYRRIGFEWVRNFVLYSVS
jgi:predicted GNAT family acetyltransferase